MVVLLGGSLIPNLRVDHTRLFGASHLARRPDPLLALLKLPQDIQHSYHNWLILFISIDDVSLESHGDTEYVKRIDRDYTI